MRHSVGGEGRLWQDELPEIAGPVPTYVQGTGVFFERFDSLSLGPVGPPKPRKLRDGEASPHENHG